MRIPSTWTALLLGLLAALSHPEPAKAADQAPPRCVALLEDDVVNIAGQLTNDGGVDGSRATRDFRDFYSGVCSLKVTPFQRFSSNLKGWSFAIAARPAPGQYRYLRFAWKRVGGEGIMIQLRNAAGSWNQRYFAGKASPTTATWGARLQVADKLPSEWTVVTRDLFKDFGEMTITGFAFTPMEGGTAGYFGHVYLGRTIQDLDKASAAALGRKPLANPLSRRQMERLWDHLLSRDVTIASPAVRTLVAGRKEALPFLRQCLQAKPARPDARRIRRLIDDLDHDEFKVREQTSTELQKLGDAAIPYLQKALQQTSSPEMRSRIETLLKAHNLDEWALPSEQLRILRVIRILEWSGTSQARQVLQQLATDPVAAGLEKEVRTALARLRKR
jgi:hypothetical protein